MSKARNPDPITVTLTREEAEVLLGESERPDWLSAHRLERQASDKLRAALYSEARPTITKTSDETPLSDTTAEMHTDGKALTDSSSEGALGRLTRDRPTITEEMVEGGASGCPATDEAVAEQGGECPLCGRGPRAHKPEAALGEDE